MQILMKKIIDSKGSTKYLHYGNSEDVWDQYIDVLKKSDIMVFGITDFLSIK